MEKEDIYFKTLPALKEIEDIISSEFTIDFDRGDVLYVYDKGGYSNNSLFGTSVYGLPIQLLVNYDSTVFMNRILDVIENYNKLYTTTDATLATDSTFKDYTTYRISRMLLFYDLFKSYYRKKKIDNILSDLS